MLNAVMYLASYGFFQGGGIGDLLNYWEQAGFFSYVLPFLLIFCIVFVTINNIKLFEQNKAVSAVIAVAVGLLALQYDLVPMFFSELFPRIGIGLSIILTLLVLSGLFIDPKNKMMKWGLFFISIIIVIAILYDAGNFSYGYYLYYILDPQIMAWILFIGLIGIVVAAVTKKKPKIPNINIPLFGSPADQTPEE
jgi:hypothetical protein